MDESKLRSSLLLRMVLVGTLTIILLIPAFIVESLIIERKERKTSVVNEVSGKWGNTQTIAGPILSIPLKHTVKENDGKISTFTTLLHILPDSLAATGSISTELRYRGIFQVVLYNTKISFSGSINTGTIPQLNQGNAVPQWSDAFFTVGISDLRGIKENVVLTLNSSQLSAASGVRTDDVVSSGITFLPKITGEQKLYPFSFALDLNGSSELRFIPLGKHTEVNLSSQWNSPSFTGDFLPGQKTVTENGFSAQWKILELNRNFPQNWIGKNDEINKSSFGVHLLQTVDEYQQTYRTAKYAILIVTLTFLAFFLCEVLTKELLHPIHYTLVGLSLILFYVLVLSLSEQFGFDVAYIVSSLAILTMITLYTRAIVTHKRTVVITGSVVVTLYVFLYVVLQLEDYALLIGSVGLLGSLAAVMYLTRRVDWFSFGKTKE
ncbi:MAG: cell envelope integrity protein CreD [Bacteriovoracaceae bacterium]|nr:cell envelope integrity protein CreD [Bacteroidota bacterium]